MRNHKENPQGESPAKSRRWFLRTAIGIGAAIVIDQGPNLGERIFNREQSTIGLAEGQTLDRTTESGVLLLSGLPGRSARSIADALTPSLGQLGTVMYADYGSNGIDVPTLGKTLEKIQGGTSMKTLSLYGQSMGLEVAGELIPYIGKKFDLNYVFADCSPEDFSDVPFGEIGQLLSDDPVYAGGAIPTAINDIVVYGNPIEAYVSNDSATPALYWNEITAVRDGRRLVGTLTNYINTYNTTHKHKAKMVFLHPQNLAKDPITKDGKVLEDLQKVVPGTIDAPVGGGNQNHANPDKNALAYNSAIDAVISANGL